MTLPTTFCCPPSRPLPAPLAAPSLDLPLLARLLARCCLPARRTTLARHLLCPPLAPAAARMWPSTQSKRPARRRCLLLAVPLRPPLLLRQPAARVTASAAKAAFASFPEAKAETSRLSTVVTTSSTLATPSSSEVDKSSKIFPSLRPFPTTPPLRRFSPPPLAPPPLLGAFLRVPLRALPLPRSPPSPLCRPPLACRLLRLTSPTPALATLATLPPPVRTLRSLPLPRLRPLHSLPPPLTTLSRSVSASSPSAAALLYSPDGRSPPTRPPFVPSTATLDLTSSTTLARSTSVWNAFNCISTGVRLKTLGTS